MGEIKVAPGLRLQAFAGIDEQDCGVAARRTGDKVAGILLVSRRVGDDEASRRCREIAPGDVDCDPLFAFRREAVEQQREIERFALAAVTARFRRQRFELVVEQQSAIVEQAADEGGFAVVDAAAGDEAQQRLGARLDRCRLRRTVVPCAAGEGPDQK